MSKNFQIGRPKTQTTKSPPKDVDTVDESSAESFVVGKGREVTKTFRISEDLAFLFKKHAVECRQTEKEILISLIKQRLESAGQL